MIEGERVDIKILFVQHSSTISAWEFPNRELERKLKVRCSKRSIQKNAKAFGPEHVQRFFSAIKVEGAEQSGDAVEVVSVEVSDEIE